MGNRGFSHIGLATHDLDRTRAFYEDVLGFKPVVADRFRIAEGGHLRHIFLDVGHNQLLAFMQAVGVPRVPRDFDAGINRGLGVPAAFYHFAFEAGSPGVLAEKRDALRANGLQLEYCCMTRDLTDDDAVMQDRGTIGRAVLDIDDEPLDALPEARGLRSA